MSIINTMIMSQALKTVRKQPAHITKTMYKDIAGFPIYADENGNLFKYNGVGRIIYFPTIIKQDAKKDSFSRRDKVHV